jgi:SpoVK/Ycf46/Vps4 family AAA+-type ATPase
MDEARLLYDAFNIYYEKGIDALKSNQLDVARRNILAASETLLKLAKHADGILKQQRMKRAEELCVLADEIDQTRNRSIVKRNSAEDDISKMDRSVHSITSPNSDKEEHHFTPVSQTGVKLDDVAGLENVKEEIQKLVINPQKHPEIYHTFRKKSGGGILLYGVPGTGKTMIAQAIASEIDAKFFSIKCSDIASKWFGDSEQRIRELFDEARKFKVSIIFFDEFEALGTKRDTHSTVMKRLVPELLSQMQGFEKNKNTLLVIAATNRPWDIDTAFLRPGRFNTSIYVPIPDQKARQSIIDKQFEDIPTNHDVDLIEMVNLTEGFNGSDVVEFCEKVKEYAIQRSIETGETSPVRQQDIILTSKRVKSSVRLEDLEKISRYEKRQGLSS